MNCERKPFSIRHSARSIKATIGAKSIANINFKIWCESNQKEFFFRLLFLLFYATLAQWLRIMLKLRMLFMWCSMGIRFDNFLV
jgi:hypothetical protein